MTGFFRGLRPAPPLDRPEPANECRPKAPTLVIREYEFSRYFDLALRCWRERLSAPEEYLSLDEESLRTFLEEKQTEIYLELVEFLEAYDRCSTTKMVIAIFNYMQANLHVVPDAMVKRDFVDKLKIKNMLIETKGWEFI